MASFPRSVPPTDDTEYDPIGLEDDDYEAYDDYSTEKDLESNPSKIDVERIVPETTEKSTASTPKSDSQTKVHTQKSPTQTQQAAVNVPKYRLTQTQNRKTIIYSTTTERGIPEGFNGKIDEKKFQTRFLPSKHSENEIDQNKLNHPDTFVTVTKSVTGSLDNIQPTKSDDKKFEQTFYTKSSTCGYFTFSCNIVYGANGRSKICRPKQPTTKC